MLEPCGTSMILDRRLHRLAQVLLRALPLVLLLIDYNWIFNLLFRDHWIYYGYYRNLSEHLTTFPDVYYGTRLTMILPGWLAYRCLPPEAANLVLHLTLCYTALFSIYAVLRDTLGTRTALLAGLALGCNGFFLHAVGGDYIDGYGLAYSSLALYLLTRATRPGRWRAWLFAAGAALVALVVTNLVFLALVPFLVLHFVLLNRTRFRLPLDAGGFWLLCGGGCLLAALELIHLSLGGRFLFLMPSLEFARGAVQADPGNTFEVPVGEWGPTATWLAVPLLALAGGVWYLLCRLGRTGGWQASGRAALSYQIGFLLLTILLICWDLSPSFCLLQMWFYATPLLLIWAILALAGQWREVIESLTGAQYVVLLLVGGLANVLSTGLPVLTAPPRELIAPPLALSLGAILLLSLAPTVSISRPTVAILAWLLLAAGNWWTRQAFQLDQSFAGRAEKLQLARTHLFSPHRRACFLAVREVLRVVHRVDRKGGIFFWYDIRDSLGLLFDDVSCTYLCRRTAGMNFPNLEPGALPPAGSPTPGVTIALMSSAPEPLARARSTFAAMNLGMEVVAERAIQRGAIRFHLAILRVTPLNG